MEAEWVEWFPSVQRSSFVKTNCYMMSANSFKEPISLCHAFCARLKDIRRKGRPLFENSEKEITAVLFQSAMLRDGSMVPADRACMPKVVPILLEEPEADEEQDDQEHGPACDDLCGGVIALASRQHLGWLCSYRRVQPEKRPFKDWAKRFGKMRERWMKTGAKLQPAKTKQSISDRLSLQREWKRRRRIKAP